MSDGDQPAGGLSPPQHTLEIEVVSEGDWRPLSSLLYSRSRCSVDDHSFADAAYRGQDSSCVELDKHFVHLMDSSSEAHLVVVSVVDRVK